VTHEHRDGEVMAVDQGIGVVEDPGASTPVHSPFGGLPMGMAARRRTGPGGSGDGLAALP
jgi:hypothetical protein